MPRTIYLPDGTPVNNVPDDVTQAQIDQKTDQHYMQRAAKEGTLTAGGKVYSASGAYPDSAVGHTLAFLDAHAGGNLLASGARSADEASGGALGRAGQAWGRVLTQNPISAASDLVGSGENAALDYFSPGSGPRYHPLIPASREALGVQNLPADASTGQRLWESAGSAVTGGSLFRALGGGEKAVEAGVPLIRSALSGPVRDAVYGAGSEALGEVGDQFGPAGRAVTTALSLASPYIGRYGARLAGAQRPPVAEPTARAEFEPPKGEPAAPEPAPAQPGYVDESGKFVSYPSATPREMPPLVRETEAPAAASSADVTSKVSAPNWQTVKAQFGQLGPYAMGLMGGTLAHNLQTGPFSQVAATVVPPLVPIARQLAGMVPGLGRYAFSPTSVPWGAVLPQSVSNAPDPSAAGLSY